MTEAALLLHGSYLDDFLVIGVLVYLVIMFGLSRLRVRRLKRDKLRRRAERQAQAQPPSAKEPEA